VPTLAELVLTPEHPRRRIAVCVDARAGEELSNVPAYLEEVSELGVRPDILFLDTSNEVILQRYSESRRRHPNAPEGVVEDGIRRERKLLLPLRERADLVIDTSKTSVSELRERLADVFQGPKEKKALLVTVMSFGFKHGLPPEADLVMDVRFLPNPHYDSELRPWTGNAPDVRDYVLNNQAARDFLEKWQGLLKFLMPNYEAEPKSYLTVAVGCTGGRHRSVAVAHQIAVFIRNLGYQVRLRHRDINRGA
jgi:UPF0042 nucleotide-binding protein